MITRQFEVYLNRTKNPPLCINVNQYDSGEKWVFTLLTEDGTAYTPSSGAIVGVKSDGNGIAVNGTVENGKVVIMETEQMTASAGKATFELSIDELTHGTANFYVIVEPKPTDEAVMSDSDLSLIQKALDFTADVFVVNFESKYFDQWYTEADKTFEEIKAVLDANKPVIAYHRVIPTGFEENYIPYSHWSEQLTLVRRPRPSNPQDNKSFYFFGTPALELVPQTTAQFSNEMYQSCIRLNPTNNAEWVLINKEFQTV